MGDPRRFDQFASLIQRHFPSSTRIADVAGGKGYLQCALRWRGFTSVHTFDKRQGRKHRPGRFEYSYRLFDELVGTPFDLLVGMHPDEATDVIIVEAARRRVPFAVSPCCIKPFARAYFGAYSFSGWLAHLTALAINEGFDVTTEHLPISGRSLVIIGNPAQPAPGRRGYGSADRH